MSDFRSSIEKSAWKIVENLPEFHWSDLVRRGVTKSTAEMVIRRWSQTGKIRQMRKDGHRKIWVNASRPVETEQNGSAPRSERDAMWTIMSRLKAFTPTDIAAHVNAAGFEVTVDLARAYCRQLLKTGYLRCVQTAIPSKREAAYRMINQTGPRAPRSATVSGILDPNTGSFTPFSGDLS